MEQDKEKPRRGWGPPIAGLIVALTALSLDTLSPITRRLPIHWVPVMGVAAGLMLACWPWAWRLLRRDRRRRSLWSGSALALFPLACLGAYLLWTPPLVGVVPVPPMAFSATGQRHLAYELRIKHYGFRQHRLTQVRVSAEDGSWTRTFDARRLADSPPQASDAQSSFVPLPAGRDTTLFLWVALKESETLPDLLHHQLLLADGSDQGSFQSASAPPGTSRRIAKPALLEGTRVVDGPSMRRRRHRRLPAIEAPLRGGPWLARNGPSNHSPHRRSRVLGHISQRFAIDWLRIDSQGQTRRAPQEDGLGHVSSETPARPLRNEDFLAFGEDVRAAFSGTVAAIRDGAPDHPPGGPEQPVTLSNFAGNYVVLRHDQGYCALYAHLKRGSIRVRPGQKVFSQRLLGQIGNSGNSDQPQLHFQIADDCDLLRSEGLPYHLRSFRSHGFLPAEGDLAPSGPGQPVQYALPLGNQVVTFPDAPEAGK